jgi:hypothetical protein
VATLNLADIDNFGAIDADEDTLLHDCFQDHPAYTAAKAHRRFLVTGRKGSGKTAIFKRLITEREPSLFSFGHTIDDYPWHHHDLQAEAGLPEDRSPHAPTALGVIGIDRSRTLRRPRLASCSHFGQT